MLEYSAPAIACRQTVGVCGGNSKNIPPHQEENLPVGSPRFPAARLEDQPRRHNQRPLAAMFPGKSADVLASRSLNRQRHVTAKPEQVGMFAAESERTPYRKQLHSLVGPMGKQVGGQGRQVAAGALPQFRQQLAAIRKIDWPPIVGIDQMEIP
jgi:hypothetical protein